MSKKSFKDNLNPAMQFITVPAKDSPPADEATPQLEDIMPSAPPKGYKLNPIYIEKKDKRLQLLMQPSLYERIRAKAEQEKTSVNDFIHSLLDKTLKEDK